MRVKLYSGHLTVPDAGRRSGHREVSALIATTNFHRVAEIIKTTIYDDWEDLGTAAENENIAGAAEAFALVDTPVYERDGAWVPCFDDPDRGTIDLSDEAKAFEAQRRTNIHRGARDCPDLADLVKAAFVEGFKSGKAGRGSADDCWRTSVAIKLLPDEFHD